METARSYGIFNGQNCRQGLVLGVNTRSAQPCCLWRFGQYPRHRLLMKNNLCGEERLIMAGNAGIAFPGNIRRS